MSAQRRTRRSRRTTGSEGAPVSGGPSMPEEESTYMLDNGISLTNSPPGNVGRYINLQPGAWLAARILLYKFSSFPRLWSPGPDALNEAGNGSFQYNWVGWIERLDTMRKDVGPWREAAIFLASMTQPVTHRTIEDMTKAIIELALRDAEIERAAFRTADPLVPVRLTNERAFMARVRTATTYRPRSQRIERHLYRALEACDASLLRRIVNEAPLDNHVRHMEQNTGFF